MSANDGKIDSFVRHGNRIAHYLVTAFVLLAGQLLLRHVEWQGSSQLHTLMELAATLLALFVGAMALIRFFSQRDDQFLYIGAGFLGTALLDGYHAVVTYSYFQPYMPSGMPYLVPWSWLASRLFLAILMFVSWLLWFKHRGDMTSAPKTKTVFTATALATLCLFLFFLVVPLPRYSFEEVIVHRPFELVPAMFLLLALIGYLYKGDWRHDSFDHWLVLSLIVGLATQTAFMPFSDQLYDTEFNLAHLLKKTSYLLVLIGLLISLYQTYQQLRAETEKRRRGELLLLERAEALTKSESWFRAVADYTHDWEYWVAPDGKMLYVSPACERITGYAAQAFMSGQVKIEQLLSPLERMAVVHHLREINTLETTELDFRIVTQAGEERWIGHVCQPIYDKSGQFLGRRASNRDITERKLAELQTLALTTALHFSPAMVVITDASGNIEYVNPKFAEVTGFPAAEALGKNPRILKSGQHPDDFYAQMWATLTTGATWTGELINKRRDGELYWESASISPILDEEGVIKRYVAVKQEITEKKKLEETLYRQANFDALTGLPNRNLFHDRLELALKKAARSTAQLALMMLDLDYFKEINDSFGHDAGDELLKQAAERMQSCIRDFDTVGRMGGDEFMILLEGFSEMRIPQEIAQRLLDELAKPFVIFGREGRVSVSIGVAFSSPQAMDKDALKKQADIALYQAKEHGRNRVVFFKS
ncbi:diguanylate cyclase [Methylomonas montana]|uniref:diguanylate cyclase domain-containing protein n=1 Tax=Methylomonas montana TaxID=3058963 RepID=UPI00265959A4|nr:diguanylate cyclase [Methylomonas montana]WKJ91186.1 diguanylate cyclase [Methylomonas montana]